MAEALPTNLIQAIRYFADEDVAVEYVAKLRWVSGPVCPDCGGTSHSFISTRRLWKCRECKRQFSVKVGTIFEDSPIKLGTWLAAIWMIANSKNGVSSHEMGRSLGITQKSAWFLNHRIRLAMQCGSFDKFDGETEADETFIGGKARNMHKSVRVTKVRGSGDVRSKSIVAGTLQRTRNGQSSRVRAIVLQGARTTHTLQSMVVRDVKSGATIFTDEHLAYVGLDGEFDHKTINHAVRYVEGRVHTNGIENFWSLLKRGIHGTYVQVAPWHLFRYVDERVFTFNERDLSDLGRFSLVLNRVSGRRLTYGQLTAKV